jgi:primase-polymerase (primpol)-like protein
MSAATASAPPRYRVENIPAELIALPRWCVFQITHGPDGKTKKLPLIPGITGKAHAKNNDPQTWRSFDVALADAEARGLYLAFVFDRDLPYFFLDADDVIQPDGTIRPDVALVRDQLDTYSELSVGGDGLHIIGRGAFPAHSAPREVPSGCKPIERYPLHGPRFCIFTGNTLPGLATIEERGDVLAALFPPRATSHANGSTDSAGYRGPAGTLTDAESAGTIAWAKPLWTDGRRHHMALYLKWGARQTRRSAGAGRGHH